MDQNDTKVKILPKPRPPVPRQPTRIGILGEGTMLENLSRRKAAAATPHLESSADFQEFRPKAKVVEFTLPTTASLGLPSKPIVLPSNESEDVPRAATAVSGRRW